MTSRRMCVAARCFTRNWVDHHNCCWLRLMNNRLVTTQAYFLRCCCVRTSRHKCAKRSLSLFTIAC